MQHVKVITSMLFLCCTKVSFYLYKVLWLVSNLPETSEI